VTSEVFQIAAPTRPTVLAEQYRPATGGMPPSQSLPRAATEQHPRSAMSHQIAVAQARIAALEEVLRDVLDRIRPQGHPDWELNTCLVTDAQLAQWWATLDVTHVSPRNEQR
jgi:hypothetical protein